MQNTIFVCRPGAVCNATLDEYHRAVKTASGIFVIKVAKHKTGKYGSAKLTLDDMLANYVQHIRPMSLDAEVEDPGTLFVLPGSKQIRKWSNINSYLINKLQVTIPTSTMVRKIGTTCAARLLDPTANGLVTSQMSHHSAVSIKHYRCTAGAEDAASAFKIMENLWVQPSTSEDSTEEPKQYRTWNVEQNKELMRLFRRNIANGTVCSLSEAKQVLQHFPGRTAKNIQDKVRTIINKQKREK